MREFVECTRFGPRLSPGGEYYDGIPIRQVKTNGANPTSITEVEFIAQRRVLPSDTRTGSVRVR